MKVTIKQWHQVATWHWEVGSDDLCGICRVLFDGTCPECRFPGDGCPMVAGGCTHHFHEHCIDKWLNQESAKGVCPMCRQEWVVLGEGGENEGGENEGGENEDGENER